MAEMMRGMDPKQLNDMMAMSEQLHSSGAGSSHAFGAAGAASMNPAVAVDMMRNMSPEQIELMAKAAADSGMMPPGAAISPELLKVCPLNFQISKCFLKLLQCEFVRLACCGFRFRLLNLCISLLQPEPHDVPKSDQAGRSQCSTHALFDFSPTP